MLIRRDDDLQEPEDPGEVVINRNRLTFKDLDGIRKVADLPLPGVLKLPTGSCEAMLLRVSRNNGFGYVPINEYIRDRQTILDKSGNNGLFLNSHDPSMEALVYKTTVSVPEMPENSMFWSIYVNMEDSRDFLTVAGSNGTMRRLTLSFSDYKGMDDIGRIPCTELNEILSERVLTLHKVIRKHYPRKLKFRFGPVLDNGGANPSHLATLLHANAEVTHTDLPRIFTGEGRASVSTDPILLTLLKKLARETAQKTLTEYDTDLE